MIRQMMRDISFVSSTTRSMLIPSPSSHSRSVF
jgi:hypothetical protein